MAKAGDEFENQVMQLYRVLTRGEHNTSVEGPKIYIDSPDGGREFDIVVNSKVAGMLLTTVIECRDYKRPLDITHIDGFSSKISDTNANKGVIISRNGFSKKALEKARRVGISTYTFQSLKDNPKNFENISHIPLMYAFIEDYNYTSHFQVKGVHSVSGLSKGYADRCMEAISSNPDSMRSFHIAVFQRFFSDYPDFEEIVNNGFQERKILARSDQVVQVLKMEPTTEGPYMVSVSGFGGIAVEVYNPFIQLVIERADCRFGDPYIGDDYMSFVEIFNENEYSHVITVSKEEKSFGDLIENLDECICEPQEIPKSGLMRCVFIRKDKKSRKTIIAEKFDEEVIDVRKRLLGIRSDLRKQKFEKIVGGTSTLLRMASRKKLDE